MTDRLALFKAALADRYVFEGELGRGGMATVFLAEDRAQQRKVAIKVIGPDLPAAPHPGRARFLREVTVQTSLDHPNILPVLDAGEAAGIPYVVTPLLGGGTLRERLTREKQLPLKDALQIASDVAGALAYAHKRGIIHRDIKPENVFLEAGHAIVADFGLAEVMAAEAEGQRLTRTGLSVGTPSYMSPEQVTGEHVDGRSDIYSLGCVLYEMLAGETPYAGPSVQAIIAKQLSHPMPSLRTVRGTVPPALEAVIRRALAKAPTDRFADAAEFGIALGSPVITEEFLAVRKSRGLFSFAYRPRVKGSITSSILAGLKSLVRRQEDQVLLGAAAPEAVRAGEEFVAWFSAYRKHFEPAVRRQLQEQSPRAMPRLALQKCRWPTGTSVLVKVAGDHLQISPEAEEFTWQGDWCTLPFDIRVLPDAPLGVTVLKFDVYIGPLRVARVRLDLSIVASMKARRVGRSTAEPARTAFASYALDDRDEVLGRISSLSTTTGLDVFVDCLSLRPGEKWKSRLRREIGKRQLFLLFWSLPAKQSEWVEWEWKTALDLRGLDVIQPHPLCPVTEAPPPAELESLHFGDAYVLGRDAFRRVNKG